MLFCVFLAILSAAVVTGQYGSLTAPSGVNFVGIRYNIVEGNKLPDQIAFSSRLSCVEDKETKASIVFGSKSYQSKLKADVEASGIYSYFK